MMFPCVFFFLDVSGGQHLFRLRGMLLRGMAPEDVAEIVEVPSSQVLSFLGSDPAADAADATPTSGQLPLGGERRTSQLRFISMMGLF